MERLVWQQAGTPSRNDESSQRHYERVQEELRQADVTFYGMAKFTSRYLHQVIKSDEHIIGAVYGRYKEGGGLLSFVEGMLVATDYRVLFLEYRPGFTNLEEMSYDIVSGIQHQTAGPFSSVTLFTKIGDFTLTFANEQCIRHFIAAVENKRIPQTSLPESALGSARNIRGLEFLSSHQIGVISTMNQSGQVHGAAVHYTIGNDNCIYILTKSGTTKAHNMIATHTAALTVYDTETLETVQLNGNATIENRQPFKEYAFQTLAQPQSYKSKRQIPPVTSLQEGSFIVFRIEPTTLTFSCYAEPGLPQINSAISDESRVETREQSKQP